MHALIIEDDEVIGQNVAAMLAKEGFVTTVVTNAKDGLYQTEIETYDILIIDWMLPDGEGIQIVRSLRQKGIVTPVIMLTAKSQIEDKVEGFTTGADDYLTKPFSQKELLVRVKALVRRKPYISRTPIIKVADLTIDTNTHKVERCGVTIALAPKEYSLLEFLIFHTNEAVDRMRLLHHVWGEEIDEFSNTVDVHIRYLRRKIDDGHRLKLIRTVVGKGYMLCDGCD